jgi:thioredoxin reductase (NADPH)
MTSLNEKPVRGEALKYYRRVAAHYDLDIRQYQTVEKITGEDGNFVTHAIDSRGCAQQYGSKKVILAMGYYDVPNKLNVPGEDLPKVIHYYRSARIVVDRGTRDAGASRRRDSQEREVLDQAQHREPH